MLISALCGTLLPGRDEPLKGAGQRAESQEEAGMAVYKGRGEPAMPHPARMGWAARSVTLLQTF